MRITSQHLQNIINDEIRIIEAKKKKKKTSWDKARTIGLPSGIQPTLSLAISEGGGAVDAETAKELIKKYATGLKDIGINVDNVESFPVLGIGTHGTAFEVGPNRVLKITNDPQEAAVANALLNSELPNIVKFYDIWSFGKTGLFGILQEKLEPLPSAEAKTFNDALIATGLPVWIKNADGDWKKAHSLTKQYIKRSVAKKFADPASTEAEEFEAELERQLYILSWKYGIEDMFDTLTSLGIDFHDYHAGNMMRRKDGTLVLIDLGISKIKDAGGPVRNLDEAYLLALRNLIREELELNILNP